MHTFDEGGGSCARFSPTNYPQLQHLLRKDPSNYYEEFLQQENHFKSLLSLHFNDDQAHNAFFSSHHATLMANIPLNTLSFSPLVNFLAHTSACYESRGEHLTSFIQHLIRLVKLSIKSKDSGLCRSLILALMIARHKCTHSEMVLLVIESLFETSSFLPDLVYEHLLQETRNLSRIQITKKIFKEKIAFSLDPAPNQNGYCDNVLFIIRLAIEMFNTGIWRDSEIVRLLSGCCCNMLSLSFSSNPKVSLLAINFFLGNVAKSSKQSTNIVSDAQDALESIKRSLRTSGTNRSKLRKEKKAKKKLVDSTKDSTNTDKNEEGNTTDSFTPNLLAFDLLSDPYEFCERLGTMLTMNKNLTYDHRLLVLRLQSILISHHKLVIGSFYERILRYLKPTQKECTRILAYAANAFHSELFLEETESENNFSIIQTLTSTIARNFVAEHCRPEVITVGLNTLREIASRLPSAISKDILEDVLVFSTPKASSSGMSKATTHNKGVLIAAKSLLSIYRSTSPLLLPARFRGRSVQGLKKKDALTAALVSSSETNLIALKTKADESSSDEDSESDEYDSSQSSEYDSEDEDIDSDNLLEPTDTDIAENESASTGLDEKSKSISNLVSEMSIRFLSPEELDKLHESNGDDDEDNGAEVALTSIHRGAHPGGKPSKEERLKLVLAGREGRQYNKKHHSSESKQKKKTKSFMMMIHKRGGRLSKNAPRGKNTPKGNASAQKKKQGKKRK